MKYLLTAAAAFSLLTGTAALAQPDRHDDHPAPAMMMKGPAMKGPAMRGGPAMAMHGPSHADWRKGGRIEKNDWNRGQHIDYRQHHLKAPPRGYEWRQVDNNYILAAAATGLIASIIIASH